mgnify:CR=1 FL=1
MAIKLRVKQKKSKIGQPPKLRATLKGLGLSRPGHTRVLKDTPEIRGMIMKVQHLVSVEPVE